MEHVQLGKAGPSVSAIGLGAGMRGFVAAIKPSVAIGMGAPAARGRYRADRRANPAIPVPLRCGDRGSA